MTGAAWVLAITILFSPVVNAQLSQYKLVQCMGAFGILAQNPADSDALSALHLLKVDLGDSPISETPTDEIAVSSDSPTMDLGAARRRLLEIEMRPDSTVSESRVVLGEDFDLTLENYASP